MIHPLVSILMPSLNKVAFLPAAVHRFLTQSYMHIELIVVDGGSVDGSQAWLAQQQALELAVSARSDGVVFADERDTAQLEQLIRAFKVKSHPRRLAV